MKKYFIFGLMALGLTSACSNDEILEQRQAAEISYVPAVAVPTRGVTTNTNIKEFVVDGFLTVDNNSSVYVDNSVYNRIDDKWSSDATYFWPYTGNLDFYAFCPVNTKDKVVYKVEDGKRIATIENYEVSTLSNNFTDLLYAVNPEKSHANGSDLVPVDLNFKHALCQILFNVQNTNPALVIDIQDIRIANLASKGTYTLPLQCTMLAGGPEGSWKLADKIAGGKTYDAYIAAVDNITPESGIVNLTTTENGAMLLLPQTANAWDPNADAENENFGSYILVKCRVWAVNGEEKTLIWPNVNNTAGELVYREVAVPVDINWEQGKRYVYTLVFGDGAGYIPPTDTNPGNEVNLGTGEKVLKPISYNINVDDFENVDGLDLYSVK